MDDPCLRTSAPLYLFAARLACYSTGTHGEEQRGRKLCYEQTRQGSTSRRPQTRASQALCYCMLTENAARVSSMVGQKYPLVDGTCKGGRIMEGPSLRAAHTSKHASFCVPVSLSAGLLLCGISLLHYTLYILCTFGNVLSYVAPTDGKDCLCVRLSDNERPCTPSSWHLDGRVMMMAEHRDDPS